MREVVASIETALAGNDDQILKVQETIAQTLGDSLPSAMGARFDVCLALSSLRFYDLAQVPTVRDGVPPEVSGVHFRSDLTRTVPLSYRDVLAMSGIASKFIPK